MDNERGGQQRLPPATRNPSRVKVKAKDDGKHNGILWVKKKCVCVWDPGVAPSVSDVSDSRFFLNRSSPAEGIKCQLPKISHDTCSLVIQFTKAPVE